MPTKGPVVITLPGDAYTSDGVKAQATLRRTMCCKKIRKVRCTSDRLSASHRHIVDDNVMSLSCWSISHERCNHLRRFGFLALYISGNERKSTQARRKKLPQVNSRPPPKEEGAGSIQRTLFAIKPQCYSNPNAFDRSSEETYPEHVEIVRFAQTAAATADGLSKQAVPKSGATSSTRVQALRHGSHECRRPCGRLRMTANAKDIPCKARSAPDHSGWHQSKLRTAPS